MMDVVLRRVPVKVFRNFDGAICVLFDGTGLAETGHTAGAIGLMIITLERYVKVVHAVAHRKYYRDWMTKLGLALPWIGAICLAVFPGFATTRIVNGSCVRNAVWINKSMKPAYGVVRFCCEYAIPIGVFAYCYGRIFQTIRLRRKLAHGRGHADRNQSTTMAGPSRDENTLQIQQQETGASDGTGTKLSRTEINVLKTMITIIVCFIIFWTVIDIAKLFQILEMPILDYNAFILCGSMAFSSFSVNPFIYASRYEVFRRYLKKMMNRGASTNPA